jgi:hypothetical protein
MQQRLGQQLMRKLFDKRQVWAQFGIHSILSTHSDNFGGKFVCYLFNEIFRQEKGQKMGYRLYQLNLSAM